MPDKKVLILAGGFGRRLSQISTVEKPKQFHDLTGSGLSLFQQTVKRALQIARPENIVPVINIAHQAIATSQLGAIDSRLLANIVIEKEQRNTAYAIASAAAEAVQGIMVAMPADHAIEGNFSDDINQAAQFARHGKIVTFGIRPTEPDSNFGYLLENQFYEKPDEFEAEHLIEKSALWNSGIFVFDAATIISEFNRLYGSDINSIPAISFDRAIMEKTDRMHVIKAGFEWADLGTPQSLEKYHANKNKVGML